MKRLTNSVRFSELYDSIGGISAISSPRSPFKILVERGYSTVINQGIGKHNIIELTEEGKKKAEKLSKGIQMKISKAKLSKYTRFKLDLSSLKIPKLFVYLLHIYLISKRKLNKEFSPKELALSLGIQRIKQNLQQKLIDNKFVELVRLKGRYKLYKLTEKGKQKILELLTEYGLSL